jgi:hypothetical protein
MNFQRIICVFVFLSVSILVVKAQYNNAVVLKASSETTDKLKFSIWTQKSEIDLGQNITVDYSIENKSSKTFYLVKDKNYRVRFFGENMLIEAPSALPTNHGDFDFAFIQIKPKKRIFGKIEIPKEKIKSEGVLPISIGFGYVDNINGINKTLKAGDDPFPLRSELEKRIKRLYIGDLGVSIK